MKKRHENGRGEVKEAFMNCSESLMREYTFVQMMLPGEEGATPISQPWFLVDKTTMNSLQSERS